MQHAVAIRSLLCLLVLISGGTSLFATDPLVWFCPLDSFQRPEVGYGGSPEYLSLFAPDAPWTLAASRIKVFKIYPQWIMQASDSDLQRMFSNLKRRNIALALEYGVLSESDACGRGVEGFGGGSLLRAARRIATNGGSLRYLAMDEPIFFSTLYTGNNACRWNVQQMASNAAVNIRALKSEFPDVIVGDIEPVPAPNSPDWLDRYRDGMDAFRSALGYPLAFFHADVFWFASSWRSDVDALRQVSAQHGLAFGVIYNGNAEDQTDAGWIQSAEEHMVQYELESSAPDHVIFQSWHSHPKRLLPESDPSSFTNLVNRYFRARSKLTTTGDGRTVVGRLTISEAPLSGASIRVTAQPLTGSGLVADYHYSGVVPSGTTTVIMGLRVNLECGCSGTSDFFVSRFRYAENRSGGDVVERDFSRGLHGWGLSSTAAAKIESNSLHVSAAVGQSVLLNSAPVSVTPGSTFDFNVTAQVVPGSAGSGYFTLVFVGNRELGRIRLPIEAGRIPLGNATTNVDGRWGLTIPLDYPGDIQVVGIYAGNSKVWPARSSLFWKGRPMTAPTCRGSSLPDHFQKKAKKC